MKQMKGVAIIMNASGGAPEAIALKMIMQQKQHSTRQTPMGIIMPRPSAQSSASGSGGAHGGAGGAGHGDDGGRVEVFMRWCV